jgi:hypothetical protein
MWACGACGRIVVGLGPWIERHRKDWKRCEEKCIGAKTVATAKATVTAVVVCCMVRT